MQSDPTPSAPNGQSTPVDAEWKQELLRDFTRWLEPLDAVPELPAELATPVEATGLSDVVDAMVALRSETAIAGRHSNTLLKQREEQEKKQAHEQTALRSTLDSLDRRMRNDAAEQMRSAQRELLLELADVHDALSAIRKRYEGETKISFLKKERVPAAMDADLDRLGRSLAETLHRHSVEKTAECGKPFDAQTMRAVSLSEDGAPSPAV